MNFSAKTIGPKTKCEPMYVDKVNWKGKSRKVMEEWLNKGNVLIFEKVTRPSKMTKEEITWISKIMSIQGLPMEETGMEPIDLNEDSQCQICMMKWAWINDNTIHTDAEDKPLFMRKYLEEFDVQLSTYGCTIWKDGDPREDSIWKRPDEYTMRSTHKFKIAGRNAIDITMQNRFFELPENCEQFKNSIDFGMTWDGCVAVERTKVDTSKRDIIINARYVNFFKKVEGGELLQSLMILALRPTWNNPIVVLKGISMILQKKIPRDIVAGREKNSDPDRQIESDIDETEKETVWEKMKSAVTSKWLPDDEEE